MFGQTTTKSLWISVRNFDKKNFLFFSILSICFHFSTLRKFCHHHHYNNDNNKDKIWKSNVKIIYFNKTKQTNKFQCWKLTTKKWKNSFNFSFFFVCLFFCLCLLMVNLFVIDRFFIHFSLSFFSPLKGFFYQFNGGKNVSQVKEFLHLPLLNFHKTPHTLLLWKLNTFENNKQTKQKQMTADMMMIMVMLVATYFHSSLNKH